MQILQPYQKEYKTGVQLCEKLQGQGLNIPNVGDAAKILERLSYYRFKAYMLPFQDTQKQFQNNTDFADIYALYQFDEALRMLIFQNIQYIEVGVRSLFDQEMTKQSNNPFWYLDAHLFNYKNGGHAQTVNKVRTMFLESKEEFAKHYLNKYYNEFCSFYPDLPPGWVAIELMSFGNLAKLLQSVTDDKIRSFNLNRFSQKRFNVQKFQTLVNWMDVIHGVRNICGHHSRLFNRNLRSPTGIKRVLNRNIELVKTLPNEAGRQEDQLNRSYTALAAMQVILGALGYGKIGPDIQGLFDEFPVAQKFYASMGFPVNWTDETLFF